MDILTSFRQTPDLDVETEAPMSEHTSFGIGGPADILITPHSIPALVEAVKALHAAGEKPLLIGNGTNVLIRDGGIRGVVIKIANGLSRVSIDGDLLIAEAGARLASLCRTCADHGLTGMEWAAGIPGALGGALLMNAGANGGDIAKCTQWVRALKPDGEIVTLDRSQLSFGYRTSSFQGTDALIAQAGLQLQHSDPAAVHDKICRMIEERCRTQPLTLPSAGSVFKRPNGDYAGRLLDEAGAKGMRVGGAVVSTKHANFILNEGNATAKDVLALMDLVSARVKDVFNVDLVSEVCVLGDPLP